MRHTSKPIMHLPRNGFRPLIQNWTLVLWKGDGLISPQNNLSNSRSPSRMYYIALRHFPLVIPTLCCSAWRAGPRTSSRERKIFSFMLSCKRVVQCKINSKTGHCLLHKSPLGIGPAAKCLRSSVVGLSITKATATVTLLGNDGAGTLATAESTACARAVCVRRASASDELGSRCFGGGCSCVVVAGSGGSRLPAWEAKSNSSTIVGLSVTKPTSTVTLLSNHWTCAFTGSKPTAGAGTVCVRAACTGNELSTGSLGRRGRGRSRGRWGSWSSGGSRLSAWETEGNSSAIVGLSITETASAVTLLRNNGTRALAGSETTAGAGAVRVRAASTSDKLGSRCFGGGSSCVVTSSGGCGSPAWEAKGNSGTIIWLSVTEATTTVSLLSNYWTCAFTGPETTAGAGAVCVSLANTSYKLGSCSLARKVGSRNEGS